ncbi:ELOVL7 (predicted) [Pycnogonum litorale]
MMSMNFTNLLNDLRENFQNSGDPRTQDWFGVRTPWFVLCTVATYLLFICKIIPNFMHHRQPYRLKIVLLIYNSISVIFSAWFFIMLGYYGWFTKYSLIGCTSSDFSTTDHDVVMMARLSWIYWFSKVVELLDTVFFALRKKFSQITVLHLYHHSAMPMCVWFAVKYSAVGHVSFIGLTNTFVHTFMYGYYGLSTLGPQFQKYLWWKKYITKLQLVQLVLNLLHGGQILFMDCDYPNWIVYLMLSQSSCLFILFLNYYVQEYLRKSRLRRE